MSNEDFLVDFTDLSPEEIKRLQSTIKTKFTNQHQINQEARLAGTTIGQQFLLFLVDTLKGLGLMTHFGAAEFRAGVSVRLDLQAEKAILLKKLWNERAEDWAAVESPYTYMVTMQTLMEYLSINDHKQREVIISLGSGPGLYETFLGACLQHVPASRHVVIKCVDFASRMTNLNKKVLKHTTLPDGQSLLNVKPVTDDMTNLQTIKSHSVDQIICNNSLQWASNWRTAIKEMRRIMNPTGLGWLYLFVHRHAMSIRADSETKPIIELPVIEIEDLFDELEAQRFDIHNTRQIMGQPGTGQFGSRINRIFIRAKYDASGKFDSWRQKKISSAFSTMGGAMLSEES